MKKPSQRELLQEDVFDMVRAAGRVAADIYAPVIKPIKDALNAWESPVKALREYVKTTPNIRIIKILGKPVKVGGKAKWSPFSGNFGTNIYQIRFNAKVYEEEQGIFNQKSSAAAPASPGWDQPGESPGWSNRWSNPATPETLRADIERIGGKYRVVGIYDSKGESLSGLKSTPTTKSPGEIVKYLLNGDKGDTFKLIKVNSEVRIGNKTKVEFVAYYDVKGKFTPTPPSDNYVAIVGKSIEKVYKKGDSSKAPIAFTI